MYCFSGCARDKEPTCQCRRHKTGRLDPWVGKIPWRRNWQATPVFLPVKAHGQRSLDGCSPWVTMSRTRLSTCVCVHAHTHTQRNVFTTDVSVIRTTFLENNEVGCSMDFKYVRA